MDWNWSRALLTLEGEHRTVDATLKSTLPLADIDILLPGRGDQEQESGQALRMKIEQLPQKDPDRREEELGRRETSRRRGRREEREQRLLLGHCARSVHCTLRAQCPRSRRCTLIQERTLPFINVPLNFDSQPFISKGFWTSKGEINDDSRPSVYHSLESCRVEWSLLIGEHRDWP